MTRKPTPDILDPVSQETPQADAVALAMTTGDSAVAIPGSSIHFVSLAQVLLNPYQTRLSEDLHHIAGIAASIRATRATLPDTLGLQQLPLGRMVWRRRDGSIDVLEQIDYANPGAVQSLLSDGVFIQLAFGHSRLAAFELLARGFASRFPNHDASADMGLRMAFLAGDPAYTRIPLRIVYLDRLAMWQEAVRENHDRKDLNPLEEAAAMRTAMVEFGLTTAQAGETFGYQRSTAANKLRLLDLPAKALDLLAAGAITERHGRELLRLSGAAGWLATWVGELAQQAADDKLQTVADLNRRITNYIQQNGMPLPAERVSMPMGGFDREIDPPPWPLDDFAPRTDAVRGQCAGCAWLVKFDREPAPRCTDRKCYDTKERIWKERDRERQKAAALAAATAAIAPPPPPSTGSGAESPLAEPVEAEAEATVGWSKNTSGYRFNIFGDSTTPAALIERGLCGAAQCECFKLRMVDDWHVTKGVVRPDPEGAPNAVYVCEDHNRLRAQRRRLEEIEQPQKAADRKQAISDKTAETKAAKAALRELWQEIGADGLSHSQTALAVMAKGLKGYPYNAGDFDGKSLGELWEWLFWYVAEKRAEEIEYSDGKRIERWDAGKVETLAATLRSELAAARPLPAPRPARQPAPGDSQSTGWQDGWEDEDLGWYAMLMAYPWLLTAEDVFRIDSPRVLLRLIEEIDDHEGRGKLWARYNELVSQETGAKS